MDFTSEGGRINRILILAPHTDEGEIGCGGTMAKFAEEGIELYFVTFSIAGKSAIENAFSGKIFWK